YIAKHSPDRFRALTERLNIRVRK
ncbi:MAG: 30S ribosomal protein S15, partial [Cyanobacteriota bacterium]